jgi:hypothetical protein
VPLTRLLLAGALAGLAGTMTSWLVTGNLFHRFQARTPATWRPTEGYTQYTLASVATLIAAVLIALMYGMTGGIAALDGAGWLVGGLAFGFVSWVALTAPVLCSMALFVNLHRGMVIGLLLDWLLVALLAGVAAAYAMAPG